MRFLINSIRNDIKKLTGLTFNNIPDEKDTAQEIIMNETKTVIDNENFRNDFITNEVNNYSNLEKNLQQLIQEKNSLLPHNAQITDFKIISLNLPIYVGDLKDYHDYDYVKLNQIMRLYNNKDAKKIIDRISPLIVKSYTCFNIPIEMICYLPEIKNHYLNIDNSNLPDIELDLAYTNNAILQFIGNYIYNSEDNYFVKLIQVMKYKTINIEENILNNSNLNFSQIQNHNLIVKHNLHKKNKI